MPFPSVTIIMTARDRFDYAVESLKSVYEHTHVPFELIYVDGDTPKEVLPQLQALSAEKGFRIIRRDYYLQPNDSRNIGLKEAKGTYIVFIENDCVVTPGWLEALVSCAEETGCAVVSPLICEGTPLHTIVHFAGGNIGIEVDRSGGTEKRFLIDEIDRQGARVPEVRRSLKRAETKAFEFHCVLMRREVVERLGGFDEVILSKELVDFSLSLQKNGEKIYFEPASLVSFMSEPPLGPPLHGFDIPFYGLRWADEFEMKSLHRLRDKWGLSEEKFFPKRYQNIGWRRRMFIVRPLARKLTFGVPVPAFENLCYKIESIWNKRAADAHKKKVLARS